MPKTPDRHPGPIFLEPADALPDSEGEVVYYAGGVKINDSLGVYDPRDVFTLNLNRIVLELDGKVVYVGDGDVVLKG